MPKLSTFLNFIPGGIQVKLIMIGIILAVVGGGFWYLHHLQTTVSTLKTDNHDLKKDVVNRDDTIKEEDRRQDVASQIDRVYQIKRQKNEEIYQKKLEKVDKDVNEQLDKPVGPVLSHFFNDRM